MTHGDDDGEEAVILGPSQVSCGARGRPWRMTVTVKESARLQRRPSEERRHARKRGRGEVWRVRKANPPAMEG